MITIAIVKIGGERVLVATTGDIKRDEEPNTFQELIYAEGLTAKSPCYPVPATLQDCTTNHEQWRVMQYLRYR